MVDDTALYTRLAPWWPLLSPPDEYADEAAFLAAVLNSADVEVRDVLELGSGGGHNAVHLGARFRMTLVDLSTDMVAVSRELNPSMPHHVGDLRSFRLGTTFDAVLIHDAINYMTTEEELRRAIETAFVHCRPGGVAVFVPDHTVETFEPATEHGGSDDENGRGARYLAWTWDPDPGDTWVCTEYAFLLRNTDATMLRVNEVHKIGVFDRAVWHDVLTSCGFHADMIVESTEEDRRPRDILIGRRT